MRVVLLTGKGGVGKTTTAAATALLAARRGAKTLVMSTDAAHSLADVLAVPPSPDPREVLPGLYVQQVDARRRLAESWDALRDYLAGVLTSAGLESVVAEELTVLPGAEELLALLEVRDQVRSGRFDAVVVDGAATAETLRLLALPQALGWYLDRLFPVPQRVVRSLRPVMGRWLDPTGAALPDDRVIDAALRLQAELADVRETLEQASTSVRLVLTPESVVVAEARRALATLTLLGYRVDGVVANRVLPELGGDAAGPAAQWLAGWVTAQRRVLADVTQSFAPLPVRQAPYTAAEPVGEPDLLALAEQLYGEDDPLAEGDAAPVHPQVERDGPGFVLALPVPQAARDDVDLTRVGDDLVIDVAGFRRVWPLPSALRRCTVTAAALADGWLRVRFTPDATVWPADG